MSVIVCAFTLSNDGIVWIFFRTVERKKCRRTFLVQTFIIGKKILQ